MNKTLNKIKKEIINLITDISQSEEWGMSYTDEILDRLAGILFLIKEETRKSKKINKK